MSETKPVTVTFTCEWTAAYDTLLAIEGFAERVYAGRADSPDDQQQYNDLAPIVLALRAAVDAR